jgi:DNA-directed RNA polymerase specialized sigma24 family protein
MMEGQLPGSSDEGRFDSTDWGLIASARGDDPSPARRALAELCTAYWYPLYSYIRRKGYSADDAQDLTQGFFASLLARDFLRKVEPEKGRFRWFLLASCQNFLANERDHEQAVKRGGRIALVPIGIGEAEGRYAHELSNRSTPERIFQRNWAITVLNRVLDRLGEEMADAGKGELFGHLAPTLLGDGSALPYAEVARTLAMSEDAVKAAAYRLRGRYRELLRREVARTVDGPEAVDDEIRDLFLSLE